MDDVLGAAATLFISKNPKIFLSTDIMDDQPIVTDQGQQRNVRIIRSKSGLAHMSSDIRGKINGIHHIFFIHPFHLHHPSLRWS